jgi:flagellar biosynthesis chaperone FliJ
MAEGKKTIGDLKKEVKGLTDKNTELTEQLQQLSDGYQAAMMQLNQLGMLNNRYVETINLLSAQVIEGRAQP